MCVVHVEPASVWRGAPVSNHEAGCGLRDKHAHGAIYGKRCRSKPYRPVTPQEVYRKAQISQSRVYTPVPGTVL
jgi:hypothetical protein